MFCSKLIKTFFSFFFKKKKKHMLGISFQRNTIRISSADLNKLLGPSGRQAYASRTTMIYRDVQIKIILLEKTTINLLFLHLIATDTLYKTYGIPNTFSIDKNHSNSTSI